MQRKEINRESINIEKYDEKNFEHRLVTVTLFNDGDFNKYVGDIDYMIANMRRNQEKGLEDQIYIAYDDSSPIGLLELRILEGDPYISIGIIPDKRGLHYGRRLFAYFLAYLFSIHAEYESIYASINPCNIISINSVLSLGFKRVNKSKYVKNRI